MLLPPINAGILFLQLGEETRRVHLTHELTSLDTLRALIVHMFPQRLTMAMLRYRHAALPLPSASGAVHLQYETICWFPGLPAQLC